MNDDRLRTLIIKADAGAIPPGAGADELSNLVRTRYGRRRRRRLAAATAVVLFLAGFATWQLLPQRPGVEKTEIAIAQAVPEKVTSAASVSLDEFNQKISQNEQIVDRLLAAERHRRQKAEADRRLSKPAGQAYLDEQIARAAATILLTADQEKQMPAYKESSRKSYNLVIELFPQTVWADRAKESLAALIRD
jgi:hypothetical protein